MNSISTARPQAVAREHLSTARKEPPLKVKESTRIRDAGAARSRLLEMIVGATWCWKADGLDSRLADNLTVGTGKEEAHV